MARSTRNYSRVLLLVFLVVIFVGAISLPAVNADEAAVVVDEPEEETLDMDEPVKEEEPVAVVEEEVKEEEPAAVVEEVVEEVEEEEPVVVEEEEVVEAEPEETIESTEAAEVTEETTSRKLSIPFFSKLTKQDAKKIAAFSLGAWGAATGVGWAMQQFGGESD